MLLIFALLLSAADSQGDCKTRFAGASTARARRQCKNAADCAWRGQCENKVASETFGDCHAVADLTACAASANCVVRADENSVDKCVDDCALLASGKGAKKKCKLEANFHCEWRRRQGVATCHDISVVPTFCADAVSRGHCQQNRACKYREGVCEDLIKDNYDACSEITDRVFCRMHGELECNWVTENGQDSCVADGASQCTDINVDSKCNDAQARYGLAGCVWNAFGEKLLVLGDKLTGDRFNSEATFLPRCQQWLSCDLAASRSACEAGTLYRNYLGNACTWAPENVSQKCKEVPCSELDNKIACRAVGCHWARVQQKNGLTKTKNKECQNKLK